MINVSVNASRHYDVVIGNGLISEIGERIRKLHPKARNIAVVTDDNVKRLHLEPVTASIRGAGCSINTISVPPGEGSKSGSTFFSLLNWLAESQFTRSDIIVALGGGVVGDLAGFAAASYRRGVNFVQIPTTLLAMTDSSVGGKVAVNLEAGKNLAGAFYQPSLVLCDTNTLETLPADVFGDGMAEVIKYGMIGNAGLLNELQSPAAGIDENIIARCVSIKRDVVAQDEFDTGKRMLLNFGHTIGHAIERLSGYKISHGRAVAAGMMIDTRAAVRLNLCPPECLELLTAPLLRFNLPIQTDYTAEEIYEAALHDKKRAGGEITNIAPREAGRCELMTIPTGDLLGWIKTGLMDSPQ